MYQIKIEPDTATSHTKADKDDTTPNRCDLHFDLSFLGAEHGTGNYRLHVGGKEYTLSLHDENSRRSIQLPPNSHVTHYAPAVVQQANVVELLRVYGESVAGGPPTLASIAVRASADATVFGVNDAAAAVIFMNPSISLLTPKTAVTALQHIQGTPALCELQLVIQALGVRWCSTRLLSGEDQKPLLKPDGTPRYAFDLHDEVLDVSVKVSKQTKTTLYSDVSLNGSRWNLAAGKPYVNMSEGTTATLVHGMAARNSNGYSIGLNDAGPNFGVSVALNGLSDDLVIDVTVANSYIRHTSVFATFMKADGVTPMIVPDNIWLELAKDTMKFAVEAWLKVARAGDSGMLELLGGHTNTLKWCGNVGAEKTFLGIPVASSDQRFTFALPNDQGPVGKIRLRVGSLGVDSHNDADPTAAWLGIAMTLVIDLAIPTYALVTTDGEQTNTIFDSLFKSPGFLLPLALSTYTVAKDILTGSENTGADLKSALISLTDSLVTRVLTSTEVVEALAGYFGAEAVEEAIPIVGWAMKVLAMEASVEQLAQTVGEVIGSPRIVEFDLSVTMNAQITLQPNPATGGEFPATATSFTITAQYSDSTTRVFHGKIEDAKVASITADWQQIPVGGTVQLIVAMFDHNGWGVGKGMSPMLTNEINGTDQHGNKVFVSRIEVAQQLYPLARDTVYLHNQLLQYADDGSEQGYRWISRSSAPTETAFDLNTGPGGHRLEALDSLSLCDDLGLLGYSWQASGLNIPPQDQSAPLETELHTMQNIGFRPIHSALAERWPQASFMTAPVGYSKAPLMVYMRTAGQLDADDPPRCFFLDPSGDSTGGFHLRGVTPVVDPAIGIDDARRQFDLSQAKSWGRFALQPTSLAIHSNGYVVGVNPEYDTIQILRLAPRAVPDDRAPWAYMLAGPGPGAGRVSKPALVAIAPDQTIFVLEAGNRRIQAFSKGGHPVEAFPASDTPFWIPIQPSGGSATSGRATTWLSMSIDVAGYIFVLSQDGNGYDRRDFNLDIYSPEGSHLMHQNGFVAAGLAVDLWRNAYTLNFQRISGPGGRTEPSISEYIPSTPRLA
ncbi:hypothetical protein [Paraburkholderia silvatlantica]|uniref:NHL repeat containing protein n=1 Tax=Paraburkholderia silvatlantica TaxID=321895 RepID=A0A2V4UAW1_9BURK|nr:hypothetical protein [Paraburkholderia silvatlantica]PYE13164.1 hypothetical protein C7410_14912 [Paraburkholderia silvatlantica]TDQ76058.1 hypothetical protein C7412_13911 [Paraburkholderia silvatlantica]